MGTRLSQLPDIEAVVFDFGQTLVDSSDGLRMAEKESQARLMAELGIDDPQQFLPDYRRMRAEFQYNSNYSRKSLWQAVCQKHGHEINSTVLEQWESQYWQRVKENTRPFDETFEVMQKLGENYRLAVVTNTQGQERRERHRVDELPELERFFDVIVVAGDGDIPPKPDPMPFLNCLTKLQVEPSRAVYVGDDWRNDVCGARSVGMHPIWLKHHTVRRTWPEVTESALVITDLNELFNLLTK